MVINNRLQQLLKEEGIEEQNGFSGGRGFADGSSAVVLPVPVLSMLPPRFEVISEMTSAAVLPAPVLPVLLPRSEVFFEMNFAEVLAKSALPMSVC